MKYKGVGNYGAIWMDFVEGRTLDKYNWHKYAQLYADYQDMIIAGEYCGKGKSDKSAEGRQEFQQMIQGYGEA